MIKDIQDPKEDDKSELPPPQQDGLTEKQTLPPSNSPALEEYKIKWDYYKETLVNRKNLFDWYFKIVTIPASAFGIANIFSKENARFSVTDYKYVFAVIFICGFGLFISYAIETGISQTYLNRTKLIEKTLFNINYGTAKSNIFSSAAFWRLSPVILINSFVLAFSIYLFDTLIFKALIFLFAAVILLHVILYKPLLNIGKSKNKMI